ncbi:hypothetical protein [Kitasatospora sp. NPDC050543]|uniref:hypothetical protein n=1 Tax=Kitasatospora sp. NPDC050543 TaxID=3364054 RepID=UPI0037A5F892
MTGGLFQTAVLGSAESDDPLILPLEAIELDAFRRHHAEDTFWCGLLLGGFGSQPTTTLYTDRVCHFSHFPDPTGLHVCGRRARDVSPDDLYVKSAARAWLLDQDQQAGIHLREPLGSVVDIVWEYGTCGLRLHLDDAGAPVWDDDLVEPVLGTKVPVDVGTREAHRLDAFPAEVHPGADRHAAPGGCPEVRLHDDREIRVLHDRGRRTIRGRRSTDGSRSAEAGLRHRGCAPTAHRAGPRGGPALSFPVKSAC